MADAHVTKMLEVLRVIGARGIRLDQERLTEFNTDLDRRLAEIQLSLDSNQQLVPLRSWHPKEGYKRTPKDLTGLHERMFFDKTGNAVYRWARPLSFNPGSHPQVKA